MYLTNKAFTVRGNIVLSKPKKKIKVRMFVVFYFCMLIFLVLIARVAFLQIVQGKALQREASEQQTRDRIISPKRGEIMDRNGKSLAVSASADCVGVTPNEIAKTVSESKGKLSYEDIARNLSEILEVEYETVLNKLKKNTFYEIIKRKVDKDKSDAVRQYLVDNGISGVKLDEDSKRYYPYGNFASHVIGFTGTENKGLEGIEAVFDEVLSGKPGRVVSAKNANGVEMPIKYEKIIDPEDGLNVVLTIDETIQHFAEKHLENAVIENKTTMGGACIIMEVGTGEILAMATKPDYDLNAPMTISDQAVKNEINALSGKERTDKISEVLAKVWRNKAVVDTYEPGSTFKIFTSAMALDENVVSLNDVFSCSGSKNVAGTNIRCWKHGGHGSQTFLDGMKNSCNPVFMDVGARIGAQKFIDYYKGMGFTKPTGIELTGEANGLFHDANKFNEVELATSSFGQTFQVTPLQMVAATAAVANDGYFIKPRLVKALTDQNGNIVKNYEPEVVRQIISAETSQILCGALEKVVSEGTGRNAYVSGYRVAGKTGTSEKLPRNSKKYIASFLGFAPADDPKVVCLLILDEPTGDQYFGGLIAAPVVGKIMEDTLRYLNVEPLYTQEEMEKLDTSVPDLTGMEISSARSALSNQNLKIRILGNGKTVINQMPKPLAKVNVNSIITVYTENEQTVKNVTVPNVEKMTVAEATQALAGVDLNIKIEGAGASRDGSSARAYRQEPAAGTVIEQGSVISVEFRTLEVGE